MILEFKIKNQKLIRIDNEYLVNLSQEYLQCNFDFLTSDWEGLEKYVTFKVKGKSYLYLIEENMVRVPNDILKYKYFYIKLHGLKKDENLKITTNELIILLKITGWKENTYTPSKDLSSKDILTLLKDKIDDKVDHFVLEDNKLLCYSGNELKQIIPFDFLNNYYDKSEINEMLNETIINVDVSQLASQGYLIFEKYNL